MIRHRADGSLQALHWAGLQSVGLGQAADRLSEFVPPVLLGGLWLLYLAGMAGSVACTRTQESPDNVR
jgi:hypothetical protein